jgi:transcription termination/antitermination protein NusG
MEEKSALGIIFLNNLHLRSFKRKIMQYCTEKSWYVLRVRSQTERLVQVGLHQKQFELLNPTYQALSIRKDRRKILTRPIFKGYMFIRTLLNPVRHLEILKTPGVVEILKSPSGPIPVPDDQVENVRLLEKHVGACFFETDFKVGDSVFVREGPLTGLRGVIDRVDPKKLHVHVEAIPGSVMIDVEPHQVQLEKDAVYQLVSNR